MMRQSPGDRLIGSLDNALRTLFAPAAGGKRPNPVTKTRKDQPELSLADKKHSAGLMRINQAGEVAAQGLYQGHAAVARDPAILSQLENAADEERDHLNWCTERLTELDARPSVLNGLWYGGAWTLGALSGLAGDRYSLGFIAETERQVVQHLQSHLERLSGADHRSRHILETMLEEEAEHREEAESAGGTPLPPLAQALMRRAARLMTRSAYWI